MALAKNDDGVPQHLKQAYVSGWKGEQQWCSNCHEDIETLKHPSPSHRTPLGPSFLPLTWEQTRPSVIQTNAIYSGVCVQDSISWAKGCLVFLRFQEALLFGFVQATSFWEFRYSVLLLMCKDLHNEWRKQCFLCHLILSVHIIFWFTESSWPVVSECMDHCPLCSLR